MSKATSERENLAENVVPLSDAERSWIRSLERVLKAMPKRLLLVETGDVIIIVDRATSLGEHGVELYDGAADRNGVALCTVDHSFGVLMGVSG